MSDNKVTLDQLDNSAVEAMSSSVGDVNMLNTENKTIVGALAEIVGKKEIANAIGEPLAETDKFTEMSSEINGLLSTFKTNMMNAGVVVESGDKFKALIDKIQGLTEGEGNKDVQFTEGVCDNITIEVNTATNWTEYIFEQDFGFIPSRIMFQSESTRFFALERDTRIVIDSHYHYSEDNCWYMTAYNSAQGLDSYRIYISNISSTGFSLFIKTDSSCFFNSNTWYAIGVGEEDTTLRDSLASILEEEGVSVTEEDDMASLITKVDEEFSDKNNELENNKGLNVLVTENVPDVVTPNQIVLISDIQPTSIHVGYNGVITPTNESDIVIEHGIKNNNICTLYNSNITSYLYLNNAIQYIDGVSDTITGYVGINDMWSKFSYGKNYVIKNGVFVNGGDIQNWGRFGVSHAYKDNYIELLMEAGSTDARNGSCFCINKAIDTTDCDYVNLIGVVGYATMYGGNLTFWLSSNNDPSLIDYDYDTKIEQELNDFNIEFNTKSYSGAKYLKIFVISMFYNNTIKLNLQNVYCR